MFTGEIRKVASVETVDKKPPTKHEIDLEWIKVALMNHPFTSYHNNGEEFVEELKAEGIQFEATPCPYKRGHYYLTRT